MQKITEGDIVEILEGAYTVFSGQSGFVLQVTEDWMLVQLNETITWFHVDEIRNITVRFGG